MDSGTDWLCEILQNVQLEQFYLPIRDQLQITRLAHFDYVHAEDLERIGISKPGIRRLLDAVRKKKLQLWNRKFWNKLFGSHSHSKEKTVSDVVVRRAVQTEPRTTCIILEKDIVLQNELGNGSFGVVKKGEWKMSESQTVPVAVKVLKADAFTQPGIYDDFRREVEAMHSLKHPNLIKLHGVVFHPLMMVCELAPMGSLLDYIRGQNGKLSLHYISRWQEQVAAGMAHLEKNRFLHRDLACRNILLSTLDLVKIGDFGLMRPLPDADDCYVMSERRRVPFPWCAPESLHARQFSHASDVWMFAVALWEMYSFGEEPWMGLNGSEILRLTLREGQRLAAPAACPPDAYMLMMQCWDLNPKERPTFAGIHKYMETFTFETAKAALSYRKEGHMTIEAGDAIILIDRRPELHWWKGQNQRTLEVGLFPSTLVTVPKNKNTPIAAKKSQTLSPVRRASSYCPTLVSPLNGCSDDSAIALRKRRTIESTQPPTTRAGNSGNKHFNYNKLTNDRTAAALQADRLRRSVRDAHSRSLNQVSSSLRSHPTTRAGNSGNKHFNYNKLTNDRTAAALQADRLRRSVRDAHSRSLNQVREDLLIDLDLPPSTTPGRNNPAVQDISLLDQPIDVPEVGLEPDWGEPSIESLPSISTNAKHYSTMHGAKSLDNLAMPYFSNYSMSVSQQPTVASAQSVVTPRPNYDIQIAPPIAQNNQESRVYSNSRYAVSPSHDVSQTQTYNNAPTQVYYNSSVNRRPIYGGVPNNATYANSNALSLERNVINSESSISNSLAEMSLDDRISASLNLKSQNSENLYANSEANAAGSSSAANRNDRYKDIPVYNNFDANSAQQQFILETKDYYTKFSTPQGVNSSNNYEKNIYVPKCEDETEKLRNFESIENSKNYSVLKYQNIDYSQYGYGSSASNWSSTWSVATYDEVNDAASVRSNIYSEIGDSPGQSGEGAWVSNQGRPRPRPSAQGQYSSLYDEVYEAATPRPHRPAPPRPSHPQP